MAHKARKISREARWRVTYFLCVESRAICRYLAIKYGNQGTPLVPAQDDNRGWALFEQFASVEATHFDAFANLVCMQKVFNP